MAIGRDNSGLRASVPVPLTTGRPRARRSDAERNRDRVLEVARRILDEGGFGAMTMDALAAGAGVGKGTLYRGFGSRAGLAEALVDEAERRLQADILTGPPPLGPGAPPAERLVAFVAAYAELLEDHVELLIETERGTPGARLHTGAYAFWHTHLTGLHRAQGRPAPSLDAHLLLAQLAADLFHHLRSTGVTPGELAAAISRSL
jgi:AcrR family transcriptional regulator